MIEKRRIIIDFINPDGILMDFLLLNRGPIDLIKKARKKLL